MRASSLLDDVSSYFRGTAMAEDVLSFGRVLLRAKRLLFGIGILQGLCKNYPRGKFVKESRYMIAVCYYSDSSDPRLDQSSTNKAIDAFAEYIEFIQLTAE